MTAVLLGLRLALSPASRLRSLAMVLAALVGALTLLTTLAIARAELATAVGYQKELPRVMLAFVATIGLPVSLLVATVGRLAASLRDRRLANLRLIGLNPTQTRIVGAVEAGAAAVVGTALAWPVWWLLRPLLGSTELAGRQWPDWALQPSTLDQVLVAVGLPGLVACLAVLPQRGDAQRALERVRRAERRPPGLWRLLPVLAGSIICLAVVLHGPQNEQSDLVIAGFFGGVILTGLGLVLVVPVFVRLAAALLVRFGRGPTARVAGRRLEAQPAGVTRVVAALLIGLFLVTGARFVLVAFENTSQYLSAAHHIEQGQQLAVTTSGKHLTEVAAGARGVEGVERVVALPQLSAAGCRDAARCLTWQAVVATCAQLKELEPSLHGCREGEPMWLRATMTEERMATEIQEVSARQRLTWVAGPADGKRARILETSAKMAALDPLPGGRSVQEELGGLNADVVLPPSLAGDLPPETSYTLVVSGPPGRDLLDRLMAQPWSAHAGFSGPAYEEYDFVARMRTIIWTVAGVILAIGLLSFGIAAVDRAVQRRREVVGLQLIGVPRSLIRRAQWLEAMVPIGVGSVLAIGLGGLAGATFLSLDEVTSMPWAQTGTIAMIAFTSAAIVAALTVVASAPRIRPDQIRRE